MKRLSILALIFFLIILYNASGAFGETAPVELWKSFELAREKDLKKDMCVILDDIRAAAYKNKKYDEYLKALFLKLLIEDGKAVRRSARSKAR